MKHFRYISAIVVTGLIIALFAVSAVVAGGLPRASRRSATPQAGTSGCRSP